MARDNGRQSVNLAALFKIMLIQAENCVNYKKNPSFASSVRWVLL